MNYMVMVGRKPKTFVLVILISALILRRLKIIDKFYEWFSKISTRSLLLLILIIAFSLRLGWIIWSPHTAPSAGTEDKYMLQHAHNLMVGKGFLTPEGNQFSAERPIGYPLLLSILFRVFGEKIWLVEWLQVICGVSTVFLIYYIGRQTINKYVGLLAAMLLAIYPTSVLASKVILEEHMFILLWLGGISLLISDFQKPNWKKIVIAGLILGISAHFRTYSFAMGLVLLFLWSLVRKDIRQGLLRSLVIQVLILTFAVPWAVRNYYKLGKPIPYTSIIGLALYYANNPVSDARSQIPPTLEQGGSPEFFNAKTEVERDQAGKKEAMKWISNHPLTFIQKGIARTIYMLGIDREGWIVKDNFYTIREGREMPPAKFSSGLDNMDNDYYGGIFLLSLIGFFLFCVSGKPTLKEKSFWFIIMTIAYYLSIVAITLGHRKYRFAIEPFFCLLAAYALIQIFLEKFIGKSMPKQAIINA